MEQDDSSLFFQFRWPMVNGQTGHGFDFPLGTDPYDLLRDVCARLPLLILFYDNEGQIHSLNQEVMTQLGWDTGDLISGDFLSQCFPDPETQRQMRYWMIHPPNGWQEVPVHGADGQVLEMIWAFVRFPNGAGLICGYNVTDVKLTQAALLETSDRYTLLTRSINDGIWDWNLTTNETFYSSRWKNILGYQDDEIGNHIDDWFKRIHPQDVERVKLNLMLHIRGQIPHFHQEFRIQHRNGAYRWALARGLVLRDAYGNARRMAGSLTDLTEHRLAEAQLLYDALHDSLTGLANRTLLLDRIEQATRHARRRSDYKFVILFIDIDRFKVINDSLGHSCGDLILIELANRLTRIVRADDTVARIGGDEFVILLDDISDNNDALGVCDRIHSELNKPFVVNDQPIALRVSIGVATRSAHIEKAENYLRNADIAMYRAKLAGGNRYQVFSEDMHLMARDRLSLEIGLRQAVERDEFTLFYQPIYRLRDNSLYGFEALIRWQHPTQGLLLPDRFISLAEETGLILSIGDWVIWRACRDLQYWHEQFPQCQLSVNVNLSNRQLMYPALAEQVLAALEQTQIPPHCLHLEITESVGIDQPDQVRETLCKLKAQGIKLSLDDFGTGYSSLSYLTHLPIDILKIDRSFVKLIPETDQRPLMIDAIVSLAKGLALEVVAEGVEHPYQVTRLRELGCDYVQGYYFSRPLTTEEVVALLAQSHTP
ncbi:diguanylate cyclase/phosphodiesterase (GGDEF & EAL domains) with PAS/PAC sensor(s) [Thermosynechococcus sp. NK55a]|jgi:diguanylate cyclase (GGDEF)-like protein/PAS domain S-box-containing protein|nr:diguanylate cyclase/phosphodiesterase (GGDEF & EAL domains) with PAS/PAC sensor(s) [Thermosynechococcus sp. NK55a]HIK23486.1 EAL domain-containing protein [Thermosynechococcus sp. M3746_W2019_013]